MSNNNLADISVFEQLQSGQHAKTGMSSMSVFNAFQVVIPDLVKKHHYQKVKFKYPTKEEAEKIAEGWQKARPENVVIRHKKVYRVWANGQSFDFYKKEDAEKVIADARVVVKVVEVK
jgi:hypothetical protein